MRFKTVFAAVTVICACMLILCIYKVIPVAEKIDVDYTVTEYSKKEQEILLPSQYDSRKINRVPSTKNQQDIGVCWAFASLSALEISLLPNEQWDFSEDNMSLSNSFGVSQNSGGDYRMSMAYLLSWQGPVLEKDDPYGDGKSPEGLSPVKHVQEIQLLPAKKYDAVKKAIYTYGGVQSSLYTSMTYYKSQSINYNDKTHAYCYIGENSPNHDSVIIGWDDNYPKDNFSIDVPSDGAFICLSSWGERFGENGCFYVSYYDSNIGTDNVVYSETGENNNYDRICQTDLCGWTGQIGYGKETAFFSNIYLADKSEKLCAAGFYAIADDTKYKLYIVRNFENEKSFNNRMLIAEGEFDYRGYYTVKLENPIELNNNEKYAVVVEVTTKKSSQPVAVEYKTNDLKLVDISDGTGYISSDGIYWEHTEDIYKCNVCLKAYLKEKQ